MDNVSFDPQRSILARLALGGTFFALCVVALGAFTRLMDAGLGCPDWPGCYGHLVAPLSQQASDMTNVANPFVAYKAWAEMVHRYFAGTLSVLIIAIIVNVFRKKCRTSVNIALASTLLLLVLYQIMLGQWTVTLKLVPWVVSQHLLGGYLIVSTLWITYLVNQKPQRFIYAPKSHALLPWAVIGVLLVFMQIMLGAWTSTNYASLSCTDFPLCMREHPFVWHLKEAFTVFSPIGINYDGGVLAPAVRQTIQMVHRLGALIVTLYLVLFSSIAMTRLMPFVRLTKILMLALGLLAVQICLGISNVIFKLPVVTAVLHTLVAVLLLLTLLTFAFRLIEMSRVRLSA